MRQPVKLMKTIQKKLTVLLTLLLSLILPSCGDDDKDDPNTNTLASFLLGTWYNNFNMTSRSITFNEDGTYYGECISRVSRAQDIGTWEFKDNKITISYKVYENYDGEDDVYRGRGIYTINVMYDEYTSTLIFYESQGSVTPSNTPVPIMLYYIEGDEQSHYFKRLYSE